jgi:hypothetical protein
MAIALGRPTLPRSAHDEAKLPQAPAVCTPPGYDVIAELLE